MATSQNNSFVTTVEQISLLNQNSVEIISKLNDIVTRTDSVVINQVDSLGKTTSYSVPTIGKLHSEITELNNNVKRLSGMNDNNVHIINGKSTKKIYLSDLNREPNQIDSIGNVTKFSKTNNWFFESLMNPTLSVKFDLTNKVGNDVDGVLSRRYIVKFEKDNYGFYTTNGETSRNDFINKFIGKKDILLSDFIDWHKNPTNTGVITNLTPIYDEQYFDFEYQEISDHGIFSVLSQNLDTVNNKLMYSINPYTYSSSNGTQKTLKVGDELILNKQDSVTRWKILETSSSDSNFRVRLERLEGFDPIPTGTNMLKIYGNPIINKQVKVTIGFDEYLVVFMKPTNSRNKIKSSLWSTGTGIYTNDLRLDTDSNVSMSQYYLNYVSDYGNLIKDMIRKVIPSDFGIVPRQPQLDESKFKVVQINKHLTDNNDREKLKDLHSQKNTVSSKLEQVNKAIIINSKEISLNTSSVKETLLNERTKLITEQDNLTKNLSSLTNQITIQVDVVNKISPKFRIRGFWPIPNGQDQTGYRTQEIIQFKIQYRYSSKDGKDPQTEGFSVTSEENVTKTGYFSNWNTYSTDIRKRTYDVVSQKWDWELEDVSDADTININQLDIAINSREKVEIRIKSISEVGYPDSLLESPWSNTILISFPDDLNSIIDENSYILEEAKLDSIKSELYTTLDSRGIIKHVQDSFSINDNYYVSHTDETIQTSIKDSNNNPYDLKSYLQFLTDRILKLEGIILSAKGILKVTLFNNITQTEIKNDSELNMNIILEDNYSIAKDNRHENKIGIIKDFYLKIQNLSSATYLSFLTIDKYDTSGTTIRQNESRDLASLVDIDDNLVIQIDNQYIYFCDTYKRDNLYIGNISNYSTNSGDTNGLINAIQSLSQNAGLSKEYINLNRTNNIGYPITGRFNLSGDTSINEWKYGNGVMGTLIAPQVKTIFDLQSKNGSSLDITHEEDIIIPINIYWIFKTSNDNTVNLSSEPYTEHNKSLRVRLNPSSISIPFDFTINFNIQNKKL